MNSKDDVLIRFAEKGELKKVSIIESESIKEPWSKKAIEEFYECNINKVLVALSDGEICGYITFSCVLDEIQIANIAVSNQYRRKKIASKMLDFLMSFATDNSYSTITLEVRESNDPARLLYNKFGFEIVGIRKNYYSSPSENAILMTHYLLGKDKTE